MSTYDIYAMGNALVDMEFKVEDEFLSANQVDKGLMTLIDQERKEVLLGAYSGDMIRACGGSAANTVIGSAQLGARTYYSCRVADDEAGKFYLEDLKSNGVDNRIDFSHIDGVTGKCIVMVTPDAQRSMSTFLGTTADYSDKEINEDALLKSNFLYIEGYLVASPSAKAAAVKAKRIADKNGIKTALTFSDPNMVSIFKSGMEEIIGSGVEIIFCNEDEALTFSGKSDLNEAIKEIRRFCNILTVTRGSKGALVSFGDDIIEVDTPQVKPIDTNGAGDMYAGAFLYGLANRHPLELCARLGCHCASAVVTNFGPRLKRDEVLNIKKSIKELA